MARDLSRIAENLREIRRRIGDACRRSNRLPSAVKLVAVTKYAEPDWVRELVSLGVIDLGESRPQQLVERSPLFSKAIRWHFIGHLQRNKARRLLPLATLIHSVDTMQLLRAIDRMADELRVRPRVLLQVNIAVETAKHGFSFDELISDWTTVQECRNVEIQGLMTMAPLADDVEEIRPVFRRLRELRDELAAKSAGTMPLSELSMGMSRDFEVAIEEGATIVRVGSELFSGLEAT